MPTPRVAGPGYDELVSGRTVYTYVGGSPINAIDPSGLFKVIPPTFVEISLHSPRMRCASRRPQNQLLQQRAQELQSLGNMLQNAINNAPDCGCKHTFEQLFNNWVVRPNLPNAPGGDYTASTYLTWSNGQVAGGDSTFYNNAWLFSDQAYGILTPFLH
jgi:hypothetical protein